MIRLTAPDLTATTVSKLAAYQTTIENAGDYTARALKAGNEFSRKNTSTNPAFKEVRKKLTYMCIGPRRCNYCEDSVADEVEHIAPKTLYPERCFVWENYCYACGPCNGPKNNKYAIIGADNSLYKIPPHNRVIKPFIQPPQGAEALLNPRTENPLRYLFLDITSTYFFIPLPDEDTIDYLRAQYTIDILGLNSRSYLVKARQIAYTNFRARLREYIHQSRNGANASELAVLRQNLHDEHHQTVWQEMKRQRNTIPELTQLIHQLSDPQLWDLTQNDAS